MDEIIVTTPAKTPIVLTTRYVDSFANAQYILSSKRLNSCFPTEINLFQKETYLLADLDTVSHILAIENNVGISQITKSIAFPSHLMFILTYPKRPTLFTGSFSQ